LAGGPPQGLSSPPMTPVTPPSMPHMNVPPPPLTEPEPADLLGAAAAAVGLGHVVERHRESLATALDHPVAQLAQDEGLLQAIQVQAETPGQLSPEIVKYVARLVKSSPFFANALPPALVRALESPEAQEGRLAPHFHQMLAVQMQAHPQIARVIPPELLSARSVSQAAATVAGDLTERLAEKLKANPRVGTALKYVVNNFPGFKKRLPAEIVAMLPEGPGKIDSGTLLALMQEFPEIKKIIPAPIQAMINSYANKKKKA
ncbi:MAG: hypothetical protein AB1758_31470, partial [Candidatus Eremiobacterota bacterium]